MDSKVVVSDQVDNGDEAESLSLCEWSRPIDHDQLPAGEDETSSFEFSSDLSSEMCPAEEIFLCGKIAPFSYWPPSLHHRSESLDRAKTRMLLQARPAGKLQRASSADGPPEAGGRLRRCGSCARVQNRPAYSTSSASRPKWWYLLPFGSVRPPDMERVDIRNRQKRQSPPVASLASAGDGNKKRWKLLRVLSCSRKEAIAIR